MSQILRYEISFESYEQLQPSVQRFINVEIHSPSSDESILFCPEIYNIRLSDPQLLHAFADSFDKKGCVNSPSKNATWLSSVKREESEPQTIKESAPFLDIIDGFETELKNYAVLILPRVYYRSSQTPEIIKAFGDELLKAVGNADKRHEKTSAFCIVANEILLLSEEEYFDSFQQKVLQGEVKSRNELIGTFRTSIFQTPRGNVNIDESSIQNEALAFSSEAPKFDKFRALYFNSPQTVRTDALFELQKISSSVPYYASIIRNKLDNSTRVEYNSTVNTTPGSLASQFVPFFRFLDPQGWFSGRIVFETPRNENEEGWIAQLDNFHLCNCDLEEISQRFELPSFTGVLSDLTITNGQICNGVFRGEGGVKANSGTIPVKVVRRLNAMNMLETSPRQTMQLRFINDATPFNELELQFSLDENGVLVDSIYRNKIVAYYEKGAIKYGLFLPEKTAGQRVPYPVSLSALYESQDVQTFWNPLVRNALNHLPVPKTSRIQSIESIVR